jgi:hypothetical protein
MQTCVGHTRCPPASTSGRCMVGVLNCSESQSAGGVRLLGRLAGGKTLLLHRSTWPQSATRHRNSSLQAYGLPMAVGRPCRLQLRCSNAKKRDVTARARSTAGQVGVAAIEEVVDAPHPEVLSLSSLSGKFTSVRDSYISIQKVESLTRELQEVGQNLERLAASEGASSSGSGTVGFNLCVESAILYLVRRRNAMRMLMSCLLHLYGVLCCPCQTHRFCASQASPTPSLFFRML